MTARPLESYVQGIEGPVACVPGRVAAWLHLHTNLNDLRLSAQGVDPEVYATLTALAIVAAKWRQALGLGSPNGTRRGNGAEPGSESDLPGTGTVGHAGAPQCPAPDLTTSQAADLLDMTTRGARKAAAEGRLPGRLHAGRWLIDREGAEQYRAARLGR